jgi:hypothetical protein
MVRPPPQKTCKLDSWRTTERWRVSQGDIILIAKAGAEYPATAAGAVAAQLTCLNAMIQGCHVEPALGRFIPFFDPYRCSPPPSAAQSLR